MSFLHVDGEKCTKCGACVEVCPASLIVSARTDRGERVSKPASPAAIAWRSARSKHSTTIGRLSPGQVPVEGTALDPVPRPPSCAPAARSEATGRRGTAGKAPSDP